MDLNTSYVLVQHAADIKKAVQEALFKYILCFGSTKLGRLTMLMQWDLNTSYVLVQHHILSYVFAPTLFKYILCFGSTSSSVVPAESSTDI